MYSIIFGNKLKFLNLNDENLKIVYVSNNKKEINCFLIKYLTDSNNAQIDTEDNNDNNVELDENMYYLVYSKINEEYSKINEDNGIYNYDITSPFDIKKQKNWKLEWGL